MFVCVCVLEFVCVSVSVQVCVTGDYGYFCVQWPVVSHTQALACAHKQPHTHEHMYHECMYTNASARKHTHMCAQTSIHTHVLYAHNDGFDFGSGAAWLRGAFARANLYPLELNGYHPP